MTVKNKNFIHDIEVYSPYSSKYVPYWKKMKRRCIEGYWSEGKWMPGSLYFYVNFGRILMHINGSKTKSIGRPNLRDVEWEKAYVYMEAKGFSGFEDDTNTCSLWVKEILDMDDSEQKERLESYISRGKITETEVSNPEELHTNPKLKPYEVARTHLRKIHHKNLGKALFKNNAKNVVDLETRRIGKDLWEEEEVITKYGRVKLKDIKVGDSIYDHNGELTNVISKERFTDQLQYRVTLSDGRSVECGKGHLWNVYAVRGHHVKTETLELQSMLNNYVYHRSDGKKEYKYKVPNNKPLVKTEGNLGIDPYFLGLWLGDGNSHNTGITTEDKVIANYIQNYAESLALKVRVDNNGSNASSYTIVGSHGGDQSIKKNVILLQLRSLDLIQNKHIPKQVLNCSIEYRTKVLEGLIDSDGWCSNAGAYEIGTSYKGLQDTLPQFLNELGVIHRVTIKKTKCKDSHSFRLLTDLPQCKLKRKNKGLSKSLFANRQRDRVSIVNIEATVVKPSICIGVDNEDSLFLVGDCIVTHNSYYAGIGMIAHNFLFDGASDYDVFMESKKSGLLLSSETLVAAIDAKYTKDLLSKVQLGLDNLPGEQIINGSLHPSPLSKSYRGSFAPSKYIEAAVEMKMQGGWKTVGSRSKIHNRSFADNPLAGNGTGPNLTVIEEFGFMNNLIDSLGALKDATYEGADKFGVIWMTGTGGEGDSASISDAKEVFYDPDQYDCLCFDDIWEESGSIGYFVPYQMRLDEYRDSEGIINQDKAMVDILIKREKLKKGKSKKALMSEQQNNPIAPSEAFAIDDTNIFPVAELKEHRNWLRSASETDAFLKGQCGELVWEAGDKNVNIKWKPDLKNKLRPTSYPVKKADDNRGCIQIWEHPQKVGADIPYGLYIAGTDPYDQDQAGSSASLGSTFIYKTFHTDEGIYEWPVAEYTARPDTAKEHHENIRKLLIYYNARDLYENERNTLKMHFEHKNSLYLLSKTPTILKATENSKVQRQYGIHMTKQIKSELEIYTRDWLLEDRGDGKLNLHTIYSPGLLEELIRYNDTGNFDRVISFMLTILHRLQNHKIKVKEVIKDNSATDSFLKRAFKGKFYG